MDLQGLRFRHSPSEIEAALGHRYVVGSEIGVGGQGAVFRATRAFRPDGTPTNDAIALKLHLHSSQDIRVQREITAMQNLSHPNLPRLIEHGHCTFAGRKTRYVAWEFIEGQPLSVHLKNGPMLESQVLTIGRDVSAAIAEIWSRRIVHGDIKPWNIMLRNSGSYLMFSSLISAVLIDLGSARYLDQDTTFATLKPTKYSSQGSSFTELRPLGTIGYFSPEQIGGGALYCASDVFSLGVVMLQCLLGRHPTDYDQTALAAGIRASGSRLTASAGLLSALDRMLSVRSPSRPNPAELSRHFQRLLQTAEVLAKAAPGTEKY
jgi:eukaryotic-like serine/threonine-protein kinase